MMTKLTFLEETYEAHVIVKDSDSITGYDESGSELFRFSGISDMSLFTLEGNIQSPKPTESNRLDELEAVVNGILLGGVIL